MFKLWGFLRVVSVFIIFNELVDFIKAGGTDDDILFSGIDEESVRAD